MINKELGLSYCLEDEGFYHEVLKQFLEKERAEEIQGIFEQEDWEQYRIRVHALKSTALTIGAEEISMKAKTLEFAVKEGEIAFVRENHGDLMQGLEKLYQEITDMLSE